LKAGGGFDPNASALVAALKARAPFGSDVGTTGAIFRGACPAWVGYSGGDVKNATRRNRVTHAEAMEITFDPSKTSFSDLPEFFFQIRRAPRSRP
jgi:hypothetical protein